jgi:hypothetical protein
MASSSPAGAGGAEGQTRLNRAESADSMMSMLTPSPRPQQIKTFFGGNSDNNSVVSADTNPNFERMVRIGNVGLSVGLFERTRRILDINIEQVLGCLSESSPSFNINTVCRS